MLVTVYVTESGYDSLVKCQSAYGRLVKDETNWIQVSVPADWLSKREQFQYVTIKSK